MTQEETQAEKDLLLKDLSARLTYEVKAYVKNWSGLSRKYYEGVYTIYSVDPSLNQIYVSKKGGSVEVILGHSDYVIKPYLFPLSSLTEEQRNNICQLLLDTQNKFSPYGEINSKGCDNLFISSVKQSNALINYCLANHLDINGLIEKGLAIDATELNIYC